MSTFDIVRVRVPERSYRNELRAVKIVWTRELIRFRKDRLGIVTSLVQPLLFLFALGSGLNMTTFIFPGILCMSVMFTAIFNAASIVWDREFGFLREMLVAPVRRSSIVIGKCLGGATVAALQGVVLIVLMPLVDVPYSVPVIVGAFGLMLLLAFAMSAFGLMLAARVKQMQSFMRLSQMIVMPLFFISGALFPVSNLPGWLAVLNRLDPITYAVDPMRKLILDDVVGVTWFGWPVPSGLEVLMIAVLGLVMLAVATWEFSDSE
ncbi:ABC transporter permease [Solirubrobacter taibaiensis]|nr:ABC transporter permease [Solirubrobacter taibaiensis]